METKNCDRATIVGRVGVLALLMAAAAGAAAADNYPTKPIRLLNPLAAGGPTDILARIVAQPLSESLGKTIVVDNRPGASGNIAAEMAAKAPPDGYTLFIAGSGNFAINPRLFSKIPYDPVRDFAPIALLATAPYLLAVHPSVQATSVKELIALAKAKPGALNYGAVTGNGAHLAMGLFNTAAGIKMVHIPYRGDAPMVTALISGDIALAFLPQANGIQPLFVSADTPAALLQIFEDPAIRLKVLGPMADIDAYYLGGEGLQSTASGSTPQGIAGGYQALFRPPESLAMAQPRNISAGDFEQLRGRMHANALAAASIAGHVANNLSVVLLLEWRGRRLLFPGDAEWNVAFDGQVKKGRSNGSWNDVAGAQGGPGPAAGFP